MQQNDKMRAIADDYLHRHGMHYDTLDMQEEVRRFCREMRAGLVGEHSELMMIPTFITVGGQVPSGEEVLVMDAGGTNFRVAAVRREDDGSMVISHFAKHPMPGTRGPVDAETFFNTIADYLEPVLAQTAATKVGFCFSYITEILPSKEGRLCSFSKEVQAKGVEGRLLGASVNQVLQARGYRQLRFVLLNDTVATMLGGMAATGDVQYDSYIGYILGTGTNTCYLEQSGHITKSPEACAKKGLMAINVESGNYGSLPQGAFDRALDLVSKDPGSHKLEKMVSGAYQGTVIYKTVAGAVDEGLFSSAFAARFAQMDDFSMPQIDAFCADPQGKNPLARLADGNADDCALLYEMIDASFERAARITAIVFAALMQHCGTGKDAAQPVCITAEGTSFTKAVLFGPKLQRYIDDWITAALGLHCVVTSVEDVTLIGSAIAALLD